MIGSNHSWRQAIPGGNGQGKKNASGHLCMTDDLYTVYFVDLCKTEVEQNSQ